MYKNICSLFQGKCFSKFLYALVIKHIITLLIITMYSSDSFAQLGGYALKFDGVNDYVNLGNNVANLQPSATGFTAEAWVYIEDGAPNDQKVLMTLGGWARGYAMNIYSNASGYYLVAGIYLNGNNYYAEEAVKTTFIPTKTWTHLAMTWIQNGNLIAYQNGKLLAQVSSSTYSYTESGNLITIGEGYTNVFYSPFKGRIDEVRIWNVPRTQAEIKANMYKEISTNTNLKGYYKMNNGSGTSLSDESGNGYNGTLNNGPTWIASACFAGPKNALDFDGSDDYISISNGVILGNTFSQELWVYPTASDANYHGIIGQQPYNESPYRPPCIYQYGKKIHFGFGSGGVWHSDITSNDVLTLNSWNHIAATFNGTTYLIYVNGNQVYSSNCCSGLTPQNNAQNMIGKLDNYFMGKISEVRIWNTARTDAQIKENMMTVITGSETGLQAYYRMDYYDGSTLYDLTSNSRNGTLVSLDASDWVTASPYNTWIGSESTEWSNAANWSRGTVPASADNVGLYKWNTLSNECAVNGSYTASNFLYSSTLSSTLNSSTTINSNFILGKNLDLNGKTITLGSSAYLFESSFSLSGVSGTITTTRPLSNISSMNIAGLGATITTASNMGSTTITRGHTQQGSVSNKSILRYYDISPTNNTGLNATLTFQYNVNELNGITESNLRLFKSTDNGMSWTNMGGTVNTTNKTVTLSGISGFSRWTLGDVNSPLPVNLQSFTFSVNSRNVKLYWTTSSEQNNEGFYVERCLNNGNTYFDWQNIGYIKGNGNTNFPSHYFIEDVNLNTGIYKYRIKQVDYNHSFEYHYLNSDIEIAIPKKFTLSQNYPNPFNPSTKIDFSLPVDTEVSLIIYDISGKEIVRLLNNKLLKADYYTEVFNALNLPSGIYFYKLLCDKYTASRKFLLIK